MLKILFFIIILAKIHPGTSNPDILNLQIEKCPQVLGCRCLGDSRQDIQCFSVDESKIAELEKVYGADIQRLEFDSWQSEILHFDIFSVFPKLEILIFKDGEIESINGTIVQKSIKSISIENSELSSDSEVCDVIIRNFPNILNLSLRKNYFQKFECVGNKSKLKKLDLSRNQISHLKLPDSIRELNVSNNYLTSFQNISTDLTDLDISFNSILIWPTGNHSKFPNLRKFLAKNLKNLEIGFEIEAPNMEKMNIDGANFRFLNFHKIQTPKMKKFSARSLRNLQNVAGGLPATINDVAITDTKLRTLPAGFVKSDSSNSPKKIGFEFSTSQLLCEKCLLQWSLPVFGQSDIRKKCNFTRSEIASATCELGVIANNTGIQYGKYEKPTEISCFSYGTPPPKISWWRFRPAEKLGSYDPETDIISYENVSGIMRESYSIQPGGSLLIHSPNRSHVERYVCVVENVHGKDYGIYQFRLDYLDWYSFDVFNSVFWGGLATSLIVCLISFLLNITWILTRKSALWWIQRAERLSRVRKMVEAMEKYRVRQMESLHEKYTKRVQIVRDNYHQQVEALRVSYAAQQEKFQNYRAAQVDAVHSHLDAMRDGYNNQLTRVRDYGSKRAEQLWESYERQVNRMRTFSLQHRLKMMRQYKVKQRYVNKLLESFQAASPDAQLENEEKVRAALELADDLGTIDGSIDTPSQRLSRSSSFHSLPEYVIDEMGNVRPGIIPTPSTSIRFQSKPSSSTSPSSSGANRSPDSPPQN